MHLRTSVNLTPNAIKANFGGGGCSDLTRCNKVTVIKN